MALSAVLSGILPAFAKNNEIAVQGSTAAGGGATLIVGRLNGEVRFSVTGRFNDMAGVKLANGVMLFESSIRDLWNGNAGPLQIISREQLPDGTSRVILAVGNGLPIFNGGSVRLRSGNRLLDEDRIVLR